MRNLRIFVAGLVQTLGFLSFVMFMVACKPGIPSGILSESVMEDVLYDYHFAQGVAEANDSFQLRRYAYIQQVFHKHGITEAEFDTSMVWYSSHASYLKDIYERINLRFETQAAVLGIGVSNTGDAYSNLTANGDTANVWNGAQFHILRPGTRENKLSFTIEPDSTFRPGDSFLFRFMPNFFYQEGFREGYAAFALRFKNDSIVSAVQRFGGDYLIELRLITHPSDTLKSITGFVYLPKDENSAVYQMLALTRLSLIRFHRKATTMPSAVPSGVSGTSKPKTVDSIARPIHETGKRLSPRELREETQPTERTIQVVKQKPYRRISPKSHR